MEVMPKGRGVMGCGGCTYFDDYYDVGRGQPTRDREITGDVAQEPVFN